MILALNVLMVLVSMFFFGAHLYELLFLIDSNTGFLLYKGIITNPIMAIIIGLIITCCGILIFNDKESVKVQKAYGGFLSVIAGAFFLAGSLLSITGSSNKLDILLIGSILGGIGFIFIGVVTYKFKIWELIGVVCVSIFLITRCVDVIVLDVYSIYNILFLYKGLSAIANLAFFTAFFKLIYNQSKSSLLTTYILGFINFMLTGLSAVAFIIYYYLRSTLDLNTLLLFSGFVFIGVFSLCTSLSLTQNKKRIEIAIEEEIEDMEDLSDFNIFKGVYNDEFFNQKEGIDSQIINEVYQENVKPQNELIKPSVKKIKEVDNEKSDKILFKANENDSNFDKKTSSDGKIVFKK